eukprot:jgi/Botrbrau1/3151/Bobra.0070s0117.1
MRHALCAVLLVTYSLSISSRQPVLAVNISDEEYWTFFQRSWQKHKELFQTYEEQWKVAGAAALQ